MTYVNEIMHIVVEILLHGSVCCFQAQNVLIASLHCFQSALQIFHVFLDIYDNNSSNGNSK